MPDIETGEDLVIESTMEVEGDPQLDGGIEIGAAEEWPYVPFPPGQLDSAAPLWMPVMLAVLAAVFILAASRRR